MGHGAVLGVCQDDAAGARMEASAVLEDAIIDDDFATDAGLLGTRRFTDAHPAATEIVEI
jgi:hypothetical protein